MSAFRRFIRWLVCERIGHRWIGDPLLTGLYCRRCHQQGEDWLAWLRKPAIPQGSEHP